jgi:repressor LexA
MKNITEIEKKVIDGLIEMHQENGFAPKAIEVANNLGISSARISVVLKGLESKGLVDREGLRSGYFVTQNYKPYGKLQKVGTKIMKTLRIPFLGSIVAGNPISAYPTGTLLDLNMLLDLSDNNFALKVAGFSMKNAGILDGDIIICEKTQIAETGDIIVALMSDNTNTLKRLDKIDGRYFLMPENEDFGPIDAEDVVIQGKVVFSLRSYNE